MKSKGTMGYTLLFGAPWLGVKGQIVTVAGVDLSLLGRHQKNRLKEESLTANKLSKVTIYLQIPYIRSPSIHVPEKFDYADNYRTGPRTVFHG